MAPSNDLLGLPEEYVLKQTDFRSSRGGQFERWDHDVFDGQGKLVGKVSCWVRADFFGKIEAEGWSRQDLEGMEIAAGGAWQ